MNKRIKEIAKQAVQLVANEHTKGDVSRLNTDAYHVKDLINEKFAELIVRECIDVVDKNMPEYSCKEEYDNLCRRVERQHVIEELVQHFGVEE